MSESGAEQAKREIDESLKVIKFSMRIVGLSFGHAPWSPGQRLVFVLSIVFICYHVLADIVYMVLVFLNSPRLVDIIPYVHCFGYSFISLAKVSVLCYKKEVFGQLIDELHEIWPVRPLQDAAQLTKDRSLAALRFVHRWYCVINISGVWFYILTPIATYLYEQYRGEDTRMGHVWVSWYPFDKYHPVAHGFVYIFESYIGVTCVWIVIATDLLFVTMSSHICLLLRLLRARLAAFAYDDRTDDEYYRELIDNIKVHQRIISFCSDLEEAFSLSTFINYMFSSINICCVLFVIVILDSFLALKSKLFLLSALIQMGLICWYGDQILHMNGDIATAAYSSGWYRAAPRCRRALLFLMLRAQKPIAFTALKFTDISLVTYSSVLTTSYSYFTLLYTMYNN